MVTLEEFKEIFDLVPGEPEFEVLFRGNPASYMVIRYGDRVTFARCGNPGTPEAPYPTLQDLCHAELVDGIVLSRDWDKVEQVEVDSTWALSNPLDLEDLLDHYRKD